MPAPPLSNSFEGGTDGTTITAANSGGASGNALDAPTIGAGSTVTYAVDPLSGGLTAHVVLAATAAVTYNSWGGFGSLTGAVYLRFYLLKTAAPPGTWFYPLQCLTAAVSRSAAVAMTAASLLRFDNAAGTSIGTSTLAVPTAQWVRIEVKVVPSTTVGSIEYRLYLDADASAGSYSETKTFTGLVLGANIDSATFGLTATAANMNGQHFYYDNIAVSTVDWIGPAGTNRRFLPARMPLGV